jgi:Tol biopolymer transport system component/predicted Ser/Thr protein kinase
MPLSVGTKLGPYEILAPIGAGGMGEVYEARDTRLNRIVAVKVSKEQFSERFEQEARAVAALNHPHICQLYDVGPNYLVMEFIEGAPLKGPLPLEKATEYAGQILDALDAAHRKGITHRDLKPANILVTKQGIKLLDFGLAKQSVRLNEGDVTKALTDQGQIVGTLQYMSPEQLQGKEADARSDLFSFGCVLYELLTGKRAFDGTSAASVIVSILEREPAPLEVARPLDRIVSRSLAKDPDQRFQTARDLKAALTWALDQPPGAAATQKSKLPWVVATAGLAAVSIGMGALFWRAAPSTEPPLMRFTVDLGPDAVAGPRITATISPDGSRLAYVARGPVGTPQLATRALDESQATLLAGTEDATDPFFSPDSQWIGFFADGKMKKISVQGGGALTLCETGGAGLARGASWGADRQIVFTAGTGSVGLSSVPDSGGTPQTLTKPGSGEVSHRWPQVLPGGQAILFTSSARVGGDYDDGVIEALSLKTGKWKIVQRGGYFGRYLSSGHLVYVHQGTLFGAPFDLDRLEVKRTPAPLVEDVDASTFFGSGQFESSRNGTFVYASARSSTSAWPIVWLDSSGNTQPLLPAAPYYNVSFSPDGKRLIMRLRGVFQVYDLQHDRMTPLTFNRTQTSGSGIWTPDGKHVVFPSTVSQGQTLQWIRADGAGGAQTLLMQSKDLLIPWSFSPDGRRLAFTEVSADHPSVWTLPLDMTDPEHPKPGQPEPFLETVSHDPVFSPNGRWIAYTSSESGTLEVYVRPFPGPGGRWQVSSGGGQFPIWSRAGRELFFASLDLHIMVAGYTTSSDTFEADKARPWSNIQLLALGNTPAFDLNPDGKRFAVAVRPRAATEQSGPVHVTVILNFFDLLRRRAPVSK